MMRGIIAGSLRFRWLVLGVAAAMLFFGTGALRHSSVDVFPEFAPPRVVIQTACLGLSSEEVEEFVTVPLEQTLNGVPGLDVMRSQSVSQLSGIELIFKQGTNELHARQLVQERLSTVAPSLPTWAAPPWMMPALAATSRVMKIGLSSNTIPLTKLSTIAYWDIRERLLRVPGVVNISIWGERLQQEQVLVDPTRMRARNVSLDRVMKVTADSLDAGLLKFSNGGLIGTGGFVDGPNQRFSVNHVLPIVTPQDLGNVVVRETHGKSLRLHDVADVREGAQPLFGDAVVNGGPGLLLVVEKSPGANTLEVTHGVDKALDEMRPGLRGIKIDSTIFRPASFIEIAIHNLALALLIGCLLVTLIVVMFLFEWRAALVTIVSIPLSLIAGALVLHLRGETINTLILAGLVVAVGVVVDDAIINVENIVRRMRQRRLQGGDMPMGEVLLEAALEVRRPIVYATLINVVAIVPVFFLHGVTGAFFRPLALSYSLAVLASMVVALTVSPALAFILLVRAPLKRAESPVVRTLKRGYEWLLVRLIRRPHPALAAIGVLLLAGVFVAPRLGSDLFPTFKERDFLMHFVSSPSTGHPEVNRIVTRAGDELRAVPGVRNFGSHIGQAFTGEEIAGINFAENWMSISPDANYDKTLERIHEVADGYPGLFRDVQTYMRERISEVIVGESEPIVVRIFGPDLRVLREKADQVREALSDVRGLEDVHSAVQEEVPQVIVKVNLADADRYGLKPGDVRRAAATLVSSEEVGDIYRGGKAYDVHVWSTPKTRRDLTSIRTLPIDTPSGGHVQLADVATVRIAPTPNVVTREDASRRIDVGASLKGRDLGATVADVKKRVESVKFPLGYHAEVVGEAAERDKAESRLGKFGIFALVAIFVLLLGAFGSFRLATMLFVTLPMSLVGGLLAAYATGGTLSLGSLIGFFTVFGIASRNGILLINHCQHLERYEGVKFGPELVIRAAKERLSPILMTALATGLALVPLIVRGTIPGHEIEHPMAVVIVGGLITSTLLNLFIVPALYLRFGAYAYPGSRKSRFSWRNRKAW
jgi:CzcA family heavy metal efflux pump